MTQKQGYTFLIIIIVVSFLMKLPRIEEPLRFKMDAAIASNIAFIGESMHKGIWSRYLQGIDFRVFEKALEEDKEILYAHTPPLAYVNIITGILLFGESEWAARLFSAMQCALSCFFFFLFANKLCGLKVALLTVFLYAFNGHVLHYGRISDPHIVNSIYAPLVLWLYLRYEQRRTRGDSILFIGALFLILISAWSAYGLALVLGLHQIYLHKKKSIKILLCMTAVVIASLVTIVVVFSLALGGFDHLVGDFNDSVGTRTVFPMLQYFKMEIFRQTKIQGLFIVLVPLLLLLFNFIDKEKNKDKTVFITLVLLGGFVFPFVTMRVAAIHEYWVYWMYPGFFIGTAYFLDRAWGLKKIGKGVVLVFLLVNLAHSMWVYKNRYFKYDKDYLLASHLGKTYRSENGRGGFLVTDTKDVIQVMQFYARADYIIQVNDLEHFKKIESLWKDANIEMPLHFITIKETDLLEACPDLKVFPKNKIVDEYEAHRDESDPIWQYLRNEYQEKRVGPYYWFSLNKS
jgi:hypothetical protein